MSKLLSVVIPVYNRADSVTASVESALNELACCASELEIIVADDASADDSAGVVERRFAGDVAAGRIRVIRRPHNGGVAAARNTGVRQASGTWIMFLDSDDRLLPGCGEALVQQLQGCGGPVVFFRCVDEVGNKVGTMYLPNPLTLSLRDYVRNGSFGEALVCVRREAIAAIPFNEDLRGYEGLTIARIVREHGPAVLTPQVCRLYDHRRSDRLSAGIGLVRRMPQLARGHLLFATEFGRWLGPTRCVSLLLKAAAYAVIGGAYKLVPRRMRNT